MGMRSIAVPIVDSGRGVRAALAAIGSTNQPAWRETADVLAELKTAAREISHSMSRIPVSRLTRR